MKLQRLTTHVRPEQRDDFDLMADRTGMSAATLYRAALDLFLCEVERRPILDVIEDIERRRATGGNQP